MSSKLVLHTPVKATKVLKIANHKKFCHSVALYDKILMFNR